MVAALEWPFAAAHRFACLCLFFFLSSRRYALCIVSYPAHLGLFLYPFLNTVCTLRQYEYLRLTSLGVIGALVKMDDSEVINFLLQTEIIPLALRIMDNGSELSKTVATFIIQKILLDEMGLRCVQRRWHGSILRVAVCALLLDPAHCWHDADDVAAAAALAAVPCPSATSARRTSVSTRCRPS